MKKYYNLSEQETEKQLLLDIETIKKNDNLSREDAVNLFLDTLIYDDDILKIANNLGLLHVEDTFTATKISFMSLITIELYNYIRELATENITE